MREIFTHCSMFSTATVWNLRSVFHHVQRLWSALDV